MPVPPLADLIALTSNANGLVQESLDERILTVLAMLASGASPDGTTLPAGAAIQVTSVTTSGTVTVPAWANTVEATVVAAGGGGGGGGAAALTGGVATQTGGGGGGAGASVRYVASVTPGATLTVTIGAPGAFGTGGAASAGATGNVGAPANSGGTTTVTGGGLNITANGGGGGAGGPANSTGTTGAGLYGQGGSIAGASYTPGMGGQAISSVGINGGMSVDSPGCGGGGGGGPASATLGGGAGSPGALGVAAAGGGANTSATTAGTNATNALATSYGAGGGGGGGGAPGGAGGNGGLGGAGVVILNFMGAGGGSGGPSGTTLSPPVTITGTNPATAPLTINPAPGQSVAPVVYNSTPGPGFTQIMPSGYIYELVAAATNLLLLGIVSGDSFYRFGLTAAGQLQWGPGTAATDVTLSRNGVSQLLVNGTGATFNIGDGSTNTGAAQLNLQGTASGSPSLYYYLGGTIHWILYQASGAAPFYIRDQVNARMHMTFTPGASNAAATTEIASNVKVDAALQIGGNDATPHTWQFTSGTYNAQWFALSDTTAGVNAFACTPTGGFMTVGATGFFGTTPAAKPTVTGAKGGNAALGSLLTALSSLGLVTDTTTA